MSQTGAVIAMSSAAQSTSAGQGQGQGLGGQGGSDGSTAVRASSTTAGVAGQPSQQAGQGTVTIASNAQPATGTGQIVQPAPSIGLFGSNSHPTQATGQAVPLAAPLTFGQPGQAAGQAVNGPAPFAFGQPGQATGQANPGIVPFAFGQPGQATQANPGVVPFTFGQHGQATQVNPGIVPFAFGPPGFTFGQAGQAAGPDISGLIGPGLFGFGGHPRGSSWSTFSLPPNRGFFSLAPIRSATPEPVAISTKLPNEIMQAIINRLGESKQLATLANLLCTSRAAYTAVAPTLYDEVVITRKNARGVFLGLHKAIPLARQAKTVKSITWEEFKHPDHDIEFEKTRRKWAAGNRKKRPLHNIWPDCDIDSDDEDDPDSESNSSDASYPNEASSMRKAKLLGRIRCLHFEELPSTQFCFNLARMTRKRNTPPMHALDKLIMGPKAVWQMLDWEDRHPDLDKHPISVYIVDLRVKRVCIQLPIIDHDAEKRYMSSRLGTAEEHYSRDNVETQHAYLRKHLKGLVSGKNNELLRFSGKAGGHQPTHLTIHNLTSHIPDLFTRMVKWSEIRTCRIFYRPCACSDGHITNPIDDQYCYTHFKNPANHRVTNDALPEPGTIAEPNKLRLLELIDLDWQSGRIGKSKRNKAMIDTLESMIEGKGERQREYLQQVIATKSSSEVEACECCGNRQLSGDQSSIKRTK